jgi:hypothetical protein
MLELFVGSLATAHHLFEKGIQEKNRTGSKQAKCFYLLSYLCLSGIFLEKVCQKTLFIFLAPFQLYCCAERKL